MSGIWTMGELLVEIMRPQADMPLSQTGDFKGPFPSGAPAIFADTVAKLGCKAGIIGGVGMDDFGHCLLTRLKGHGVNCDFVDVVDGGCTGVAFVTYFKNGDRKFIFHIGNTSAASVQAPDISALAQPDFFHLMGCSLTASEAFYCEIMKTFDSFVKKGARISFDPNIRPELLQGRSMAEFVNPIMKECEVFMPGVEELLSISGESTVEYAVHKLFENPKLKIIALKRGSKGCTIFSRTENINFGVYSIVPQDATGAGDSFDAGFLCGYIEGYSLEDCAKVATAAASLNTAAFGPMEGAISAESVTKMIQEANIQ